MKKRPQIILQPLLASLIPQWSSGPSLGPVPHLFQQLRWKIRAVIYV